MNAVDAANKSEIAMIHAALNKKYGQLYADIWKVGVNLSLRISDLLIEEALLLLVFQYFKFGLWYLSMMRT
jgi:hypothetical protein